MRARGIVARSEKKKWGEYNSNSANARTRKRSWALAAAGSTHKANALKEGGGVMKEQQLRGVVSPPSELFLLLLPIIHNLHHLRGTLLPPTPQTHGKEAHAVAVFGNLKTVCRRR